MYLKFRGITSYIEKTIILELTTIRFHQLSL
nr:MAG TPA: hypothetical protein [Caudoviricetes sp.]